MIKIDEKSVLELFHKVNNNSFKTKSHIISNMVYINGRPKFVSYNRFYINQEENKIRLRLFTVSADYSEYINIPIGIHTKVYVKDLTLCIDFYDSKEKKYNIAGIDIVVGENVADNFNFSLNKYTEGELSSIIMRNTTIINEAIVNGIDILFNDLSTICIYDCSIKYATNYPTLILKDNSFDYGNIAIRLNGKNHIDIYYNSNNILCIDIK